MKAGFGERIDVIPDIHADFGRLTRTLIHLRYRETDRGWQHPEGRIAAFLGDLIDTGPDNAAVISTVRAMEINGSAVAIMGNHELNALLYHRRGENADRNGDGWMRSHNSKHTKQHATFLREFPVGAAQTGDVLEWFATLPLYLDLGDIRLVHAYWSDAHIRTIRERTDHGRLTDGDFQEIALEEDSSDFANAVLDSLKGPEAMLPTGFSFEDINGCKRNMVRLKWWKTGLNSWKEAALSVSDPQTLPDIPVSASRAISFYHADSKPVFFGHYKRLGSPTLDSANAACLDYHWQPCAYRWDGEAVLKDEQLVSVP